MAAPVTPFLIGLMVWGVYRRVRRNIGQQPLRPARIIVSLVVLSLVSALLVFVSLPFPKMLMGIGGGMLLGGALGFLGLRLTKFETTEQGHFYTPNTHIGIALSVLLIGRMLYRWWMFRDAATAAPMDQSQLFQSPLTYFILGLTLGYYFVYRIGLFVHTHDKRQLPQ
jgi:hypothetical protein